jgi:copper chaperone CopZ
MKNKMNRILFSTLLLLAISSCGSKETSLKTETKMENGISNSTFKVWGNCEMCKETIESSLKENGIKKADWNSETKMISVSYDTSKITLDKIQKNIASVGYDNVKYKGDNDAYSSLHGCCQYDRKE